MAGIGFELRRVVDRGGLGRFFQIAMSGAMIVAGPWILSIITISLINSLLSGNLGGGMELFMGVVIYSYAFSLFLFGGFHYIFTRKMSDLLYLKKESQAFGYVLQLLIPVIIASAAISLPPAFSFNPDIPYKNLFRISSALLFCAINSLWIIMLFVSVLKWYLRILLVYSAGLAASLLFILKLSNIFGTAGALFGFSIGHLIIVFLLVILCRRAWKPAYPNKDIESGGFPSRIGHAVKAFAGDIAEHRYLFGAGTLYYWGIWSDKIIFWIFKGDRVEGTFIKLFEAYDIPVFLANLSMIPGLIFFVIY